MLIFKGKMVLKRYLKIREQVIIFVALFLLIVELVSAESPQTPKSPTAVLRLNKQEAIQYRNKGYQAQNEGKLDVAMSYYQKAIILDPYFATAYNDLGIIYEAQGWLSRAGDIYLRATEVDPSYLPSYTNLALLYEKKGDLYNAFLCWRKRVELGNPRELWTQKAKERLDVLSSLSPELWREYSGVAIDLSNEVNELKKSQEEAKIVKAREYFQLGKRYLNRGDYEGARREFELALSLNPQDLEIAENYNNALRKEIETKIKDYSTLGLRFYQQGDPIAAFEEFKKILTLIPAEAH